MPDRIPPLLHQSMRVAYADPPYIGQSAKHYKNHEDFAGEVDHRELIARLETDYDGWALSLSSPSAKEILSLPEMAGALKASPEGVRMAAWVKPFAAFKKNVNPGYTWEPVIFKAARKLTADEPTVRDYLAEPITLRRGVSGAKPDAFCFWLFKLLGLEPGDEFHDLFRGSGAVWEAWLRWSNESRLVA